MRKQQDGTLVVLPKEEQERLKDKLIVHNNNDSDEEVEYSMKRGKNGRLNSNHVINQSMSFNQEVQSVDKEPRKSMQRQ